MTIVWTILGGLLGAIGGSFAVTAAGRRLEGRSTLWARSACDSCGRPLGYGETIPVLSYMVLGGRCQSCCAPISRTHPIGECLGLLAGSASFALLPPIQAGLALLLALVLLASATIDARVQRLPDQLTLAAAVLSAILGLLTGRLLWGVFAAAVATAVLLAARVLFRQRRGDPGLGLGDVKLIAALALWLGLATPWAIVGAAMLGLGAHGILRPSDGRIAFGPAIAASGIFTGLLLGQSVIQIFPDMGVWS